MHGDSFRGSGKILLLAEDKESGYQFLFTQCSTSKANDGFLPFSANVDSTAAENSVEAIDSTSSGITVDSFGFVAGNIVNVRMSYVSSGRWAIKFTMRLTDGSIKHAVFDRIFCEELSND